jgi:hypothetical protein
MATNYDFSLLSAADFEDLAKDILESKFHYRLHVYGEGKDHGIDICSDEAQPEIIGQAKRYIKSTLEELMKALKEEHEKLLALGYKPKKYYIFTTFAISGSTKDKIVALFGDFGVDAGCIYAQTDLCAFLDDPLNVGILKKYFKLYLNSFNVLSLVLHADAQNRTAYLRDQIATNLPLFYKTAIFTKASKTLAEKRCVVLIGGPGSGKTMTSNMLVSSVVAQDKEYRIVYGEDEQCKELLALIHPGEKQIIYVDDMIGKVAIELTTGESNDLKMIVAAVLRDPNKYLILNSRTALWNSLSNLNLELLKKIESSGVEPINCDGTTPYEKARILYNHLYFHHVPQEYIDDICQDRRYRAIIAHANYSPRLIESVTSPNFLKDVPAESYANAIINTLDDPNRFWENEIASRCASEDRALLLALFSLTSSWIDEETVIHVFSKYKTGLVGLDPTCSSFERSLKKLNNELVQVSMANGKRIIGFANPSVYQYVKKFIFDPENEEYRKKLVSLSIYLEQYRRLVPHFETSGELKQLILSGQYFSLKGSTDDLDAVYAEGVIRMRIITEETKKALRNVLFREEKDIKFSFFSVSFIEMIPFIAKSLPDDDYGLKPLFFDSAELRAFLALFDVEGKAKVCETIIAALSPEESEQFFEENHDVLDDVLVQVAAKVANEELQAEAINAPPDSEEGASDVQGYLDEITDTEIEDVLESERIQKLAALFSLSPSVEDVADLIDNKENAKNGIAEPDYEPDEDCEPKEWDDDVEIDALFSSISSGD